MPLFAALEASSFCAQFLSFFIGQLLESNYSYINIHGIRVLPLTVVLVVELFSKSLLAGIKVFPCELLCFKVLQLLFPCHFLLFLQILGARDDIIDDANIKGPWKSFLKYIEGTSFIFCVPSLG